MENTAVLNLTVDSNAKARAEHVLNQLGVPMSTAIDMYLNQIALTGGIPFSVALPKAPDSVNADLMTDSELQTKLQKGYADIDAGRTRDADAAFRDFREAH